MSLTTKQRKFIDAYLESGNATQAAIDAGYSERSAYSQGSRLLKNAEVSEVIQTRLRENAMSVDEALGILADMARSDVGAVFEFVDGIKEPYIRITPENSKLVKKFQRDHTGKLTVELEDRQAAIDKILKVAGAYKDRTEHSGEVIFRVVRE